MFGTDAYNSERISLTTLIGWFSLCLLAAGWGPQLDSTLTQLWTNVGLFGLVSAVGLGVGQQAREVNRQRKQRIITDRHIERYLNRFAAENGAIKDLINTALRRIAEDGEGHRNRERKGVEQRDETRLPFYHPVQVQPLDDSGSLSTENGQTTFTAYIRDISSGGVGLIHDQPIPSGLVMLMFNLQNAETVSIFAKLLWQHHQPDGKLSSGGKLIKVRTPVNLREPVMEGAGYQEFILHEETHHDDNIA
ncbi:PilZ domain protein [Gimesia alba]|uniref:PilZ domain protein n=1 Tax=Gimesia alba TaxID=2527973 RepID=A0A517RMV1_9PLAN|nr:PilZ domain-containing protein [Gimesia alba]QDT45211.1 PilZ domain protein [Gimesia alba]